LIQSKKRSENKRFNRFPGKLYFLTDAILEHEPTLFVSHPYGTLVARLL
jgi:hypothetical protein